MKRHVPATAAAVAVSAVLGTAGTDVRSSWYDDLDRPDWEPPTWSFPVVWTSLYAMIAVASGRVLDRVPDPGRRAFARALGVNLALNTGWTWLFFTARQPRWALAEILLLEASTLDLARRARHVDPRAHALLLPYAGWVAFATVLNAAIARRNP